MRILLIEDDDPMVGRALKAGIEQDSHAADWVQTASAAQSACLSLSNAQPLRAGGTQLVAASRRIAAGTFGHGL